MIGAKTSPEEIQAYLKKLSEKSDLPLYQTHTTEDFPVHIRPDKTVSPGLFRPDPLLPGVHRAHPTTIRALKKDIFYADEEFLDLEIKYQCASCQTHLDLQFWLFCPVCAAAFPSGISK